jgi:hypothetical protein
MKLRILTLAVLVFALASCKKSSSPDDETTGGTESKASLLSRATWKFDHAGIDFDGNGTIDANMPAGTLKSCEIDNTVSFNINGTGVVDEGATKCNGGTPQSAPFTWRFSHDETSLNVSTAVIAGMSGDVKVLSLGKTQMSIERVVNLGSSVNVIVFMKN